MSKVYDGDCGGICYECRCTGCRGQCAMHCFITGNIDEITLMDDNEDYVRECPEFSQHEE